MKDILPYIKFGPVTDGEYPEVFTHIFSTVKDVPEFRPLVFWIPLAKFIPVREKPLFCSCFFLIASSAPYSHINFVLDRKSVV